MKSPSSNVFLTISHSGKGPDLPEKIVSLIARLVKRAPEDVRLKLGSGSVKLKAKVNNDLDRLISILEKNGFKVKSASAEPDASGRQARPDQTTGRSLTLPVRRTVAPADWKQGDVIEGLYEVFGSAAGGMGKVYFIFHRQWKMKMAIKTPRPEAVKSEAHQLRFLREAELWVDLGLHPNIATCYYARVIQGLPRLFIEYVDGGNLDEWQDTGRSKDLRLLLDLMLQFCHGMMYAEKKGMIHRDIKPANCLISRDKILKITDFGLVKKVDENPEEDFGEDVFKDASSTTTRANLSLMEGGVAGSPWYMAPERFTNRGKDDIRSDIYSFGIMLYELALGTRPFDLSDGFSLPALIMSQIKAKPIDPLSIRDDLPKQVAEVMRTCLEKKPENRYGSFEELCTAVEKAASAVRPDKKPRPRPSLVGLKADSLNNQAVSMLDLGREKEAVRLLEDAHSSDTDHLEAVYNLHALRWARGEISDREVTGRMESLRIEIRDTPDYHHLMGLISLQRGDPVKAVTLLSKACEEAAHFKERWKGYAGGPRDYVQSLRFNPIGKKGSFAGHVKGVLSIAFSTPGNRVFSVGEDRSIRIWDVDTGRCLKNVRTFNFTPVAGAFSPDGKLAATGYGEAFRTLDLWDLEAGRLLRRNQGMGVTSLNFSPDSSRLAALGLDGRVRVLDATSGAAIFESGHLTHRVTALCFSGDGNSLLIAGEDGTLVLHLLQFQEPVYAVQVHDGPVLALSALESGQLAITGGMDETLRLVEVGSGKELHRFQGHRRKVVAVEFLSGGDYIVSGAADGAVKIWNSAGGRCYRTIMAAEEELTRLSASPDGRMLLSGGTRGSVDLWSVDTGWFEGNFLEPAICRPRTFREVSLVQEAFNARVHDFNRAWRKGENREALKIFDRIRGIAGFCWSREAILVRNILGTASRRGRLRSWTFIRSFNGHSGPVMSVQAAEDCLSLFTGSLDGTAARWDVVTGRCTLRVTVNSPVKKILLMPRGQGLLTWSSDSVLRRWDMGGDLVAETPGVELPVAIERGGRSVLAVSKDGKPVTINVETGIIVSEGPAIQGEDLGCFSEDLQSVFSLRGGRLIQRWALDSGRNEAALRDLGCKITSYLPSWKDDRLVAGMETGEVAIYVGGAGVNVISLRGHREAVRVVASGPDPGLWLTGSDDCSLRLWDVPEEKSIAVLEGHSAPVRSACFFPNASLAGSGGADGSVRLWGLEWEMGV